jgi:sugar-specific transcriptional regulator TrmB
MNRTALIEELKQIGLTDAAAKIYIILLQEGNTGASDIARIAGISRPKVYEHLRRLVDTGLCVEILGSVKKYSAANPADALKKIQNQYTRQYQSTTNTITQLTQALMPLFLTPSSHSDPLDYIQVIRERNSIIKKFESLESMARQEVLSLVKLPLVMSLDETPNPIEFQSLQRNVLYRTIYNKADMADPNLDKAVDLFAKAGELVRITRDFPIPFKMFIFDCRIVMFTLEDKTPAETKLTALIIEHKDLAAGLKQVFDLYWLNSITLEEYRSIQ